MKKLLASVCVVAAPISVALPVVLAPKLLAVLLASVITAAFGGPFFSNLAFVLFGPFPISIGVYGVAAFNPVSFTGNNLADFFLTAL